jgi:hypothetical protein
MTDQKAQPAQAPAFRTNRLEAFSDGVFAIAITLPVLEIAREGLIRSDISDKAVKTITKRLTPGLAGYLIMILLGLFLPLLAVVGYLIIALYNMLPIRDLRRPKAAA